MHHRGGDERQRGRTHLPGATRHAGQHVDRPDRRGAREQHRSVAGGLFQHRPARAHGGVDQRRGRDQGEQQ